MIKTDLERKVSVLFAADIVGFGKHAKIYEESILTNLTAHKFSGKDPSNPAKIGQSIAFGGQCGREGVRAASEGPTHLETGRCQFYKGRWELGAEAQKLDIGNFFVWDNYLTAICSSASRNGKRIVEALEPLHHKKYFWWEFNLGVAYHYLKKYQIAVDHFQNARNALGNNKIEKIERYIQNLIVTKQRSQTY